MFQRIKSIIFTIIYLLLWVRFFFMAYDPIYGGGTGPGLPIFPMWRPVLDVMYTVTYYLMAPVYFIWGLVAPVMPKLSWFPGMQTHAIVDQLSALSVNYPQLASIAGNPLLGQSLVGYLDFLVVIAMLFYKILNPVLDLLYDLVKNVFWNFFIEMSFTKRKEAKYQEALEKRAVDLMKLNSQYKSLTKEMSMLATSVITDELTKVYNKRFFLEKIGIEFKAAKEKRTLLAIAMVDIDHFKKLNDNYGHLLGDKVLQAVAQVAKKNTPADCFCCRFGGEEFAIIMPGKKMEEAIEIVASIHRQLPMLRFEEDPNLRTAASFGINIVDFRNPEAQTALNTYEDFIKLADDELYRAKLNGRNRYEVNTTYYQQGGGQMPGQASA